MAAGDAGLIHCFFIALVNRGVYLRAHPNVSASITEDDVKAALSDLSLS